MMLGNIVLAVPPVTGRVADPHWYWWIIFYFFLGGIAAGAYLLAALSDLFADHFNRPVARVGYLIAMPLVAISGLLLTLDLGEPLRFWHMLWNITTNRPSFKYWSPISYGSWLLTGFGICTGLSFVLTLAEIFGRKSFGASRLATGPLGKVVAAIGAVFAIFFGSYTGVLLNATNQRVWGDNWMFGALFAASAISTGIAAIVLVLALRRAHDDPAIQRLERADIITIVVELVLLLVTIALLANVGRAGVLVGGVLGLMIWLGVVLLGLLAPLALYLRPRLLGTLTPVVGAVLALIGGFLLRYVIVMSSQV